MLHDINIELVIVLCDLLFCLLCFLHCYIFGGWHGHHGVVAAWQGFPMRIPYSKN